MCWKVEYIVLIIISTLIDYFAAKKIARISLLQILNYLSGQLRNKARKLEVKKLGIKVVHYLYSLEEVSEKDKQRKLTSC